MRIDWATPLTRGRQVYARVRGLDVLGGINYTSGFLVGWDRWSDGHPTLDGRPWPASRS